MLVEVPFFFFTGNYWELDFFVVCVAKQRTKKKQKKNKRTWTPHVLLSDDFVILLPSEITHLVQAIQDFTDEEQNTFWINWWLTFGKNKYPIDHFDTMFEKVY